MIVVTRKIDSESGYDDTDEVKRKKRYHPPKPSYDYYCLLIVEGSSPLLRSQISSAVSSLERDQKATQPRQDLFSSLRGSLSTIFSILGTTLPESKFHRAPTREVHSPPLPFLLLCFRTRFSRNNKGERKWFLFVL